MAWLDDQPVAIDIHVAGVFLEKGEIVVVVTFRDAGVQLVAHQIRGVVTLQLHHDGQRVTQVIDRG